MPDYKKKKVKKSGKKHTARSQTADIAMKPALTPAALQLNKSKIAKSDSAPNDTSLRVVRGNREKLRRRSRIAVLVVLLITGAITILSLVLPTGIIDQLNIMRYSIGASDFPVSMSGNHTLVTEKKSGYFFTLSDTTLESYNASGKQILNSKHGFSAPVLRTSATRALVYDQGGKGYKVYKIDGTIIENNTNDSIITANVSRCGSYAVAVKSTKYASQVTVYNKRGTAVYEWNSSVEIVSDIALSPDGKELAVAVFNSENGKYISKVYVLDFNSATPKFTKEYIDKFIYSVQTNVSTGFFALSESCADFISWSKYESREFTAEYGIRMYRGNSDLSAVVSTRQNDKKDNVITVFNKKGSVIYEVKWKYGITDFSIIGSHMVILSDTSVYLLDKGGNIIRTGEAGFGGVRIVPISLENVIVITDNMLNRVSLHSNK